MESSEAAFVDVVFEIAGTSVPAEHAWALRRSLAHWLPWLEDEEGAGIHPLRAVTTGYGVALLARRARLALRVRRERAADALALSGATLDVEGSAVEVRAGIERPLHAWPTLYARRVVTGMTDGALFQADADRRLAAMGIACECISGGRRDFRAGERDLVAFGLALHGVRPGDSLRVQSEGMGSERLLGCGIFVPHKSIAAVA